MKVVQLRLLEADEADGESAFTLVSISMWRRVKPGGEGEGGMKRTILPGIDPMALSVLQVPEKRVNGLVLVGK